MDLLIAMLVMVGVGVALMKLVGYQEQQKLEAANDRAVGHLQHQRSGDYPSSCSWCKNTTLARKLVVFERTEGNWHAADVIERLRGCPDPEVPALASALRTDSGRWRRFCTEKCTREFFAAAHVDVVETFVGCDYCAVRFPLALLRCPNCGAAKTTGNAR